MSGTITVALLIARKMAIDSMSALASCMHCGAARGTVHADNCAGGAALVKIEEALAEVERLEKRESIRDALLIRESKRIDFLLRFMFPNGFNMLRAALSEDVASVDFDEDVRAVLDRAIAKEVR